MRPAARHTALSILALAAGLVAGCASTDSVETFKAPERDVAGLRSYAWKESEFGLPLVQDPALLDTARQRVRATIDEGLAAKGYVQASDAAAADFLVSYSISGQRRYATADSTRVGAPSPNEVLMPGEIQPPPASEGPREVTIREGTVAVYADDPKSGRLLWRGSVDIEQRIASSEAGLRRVLQITREIVEQFPAR
jgi:hypothetical protein